MKYHLTEEGTGVQNLALNYTGSGTSPIGASKAIWTPSGANAFEIEEIHIWAKGASSNFDQFAGLTLSNGFYFVKERKKETRAAVAWQEIFQGQVFKDTADFERFGDFKYIQDGSAATRSSTFTFDLKSDPIVIYGRNYERLAVPLSDDYHTLSKFEIWISGKLHTYL